MGQYHYVVNYDKKEFLHPHKFNAGLKLMEFGRDGGSVMLGMAVLLAASCKGGARGGGDIHPWTGGPGYQGREVQGLTEARGQWLMDNVVGRWAGDRIAIIGDYAEPEDANGLVGREGSPWTDGQLREVVWTDISELAIEAMEMDYYVWSERRKQAVA